MVDRIDHNSKERRTMGTGVREQGYTYVRNKEGRSKPVADSHLSMNRTEWGQSRKCTKQTYYVYG